MSTHIYQAYSTIPIHGVGLALTFFPDMVILCTIYQLSEHCL